MTITLSLSWFAFLFVSGVGGQQDFSISSLQRDSEIEESIMQKPVSTGMVKRAAPHSKAAVKPAAASAGKPKAAHAGVPKKKTAAKPAPAKVEKPQRVPKPTAAKLQEPLAVKAKAAEPEAPQQKPQVSADTAVEVVRAESAKSSEPAKDLFLGADIGKQISGPIFENAWHAETANIANITSSTNMTAAVRVQQGEEVDAHSTDAASRWKSKKAAKEAGLVKYRERQQKMWAERKAMDAAIENARLHPTEAPSAESIWEKRHAQKALALHRWEEEQQKSVEEQKAKVEERKAKEEERKAKEAAKEAAREYARLHPTEAPSAESIWEKRHAQKALALNRWEEEQQKSVEEQKAKVEERKAKAAAREYARLHPTEAPTPQSIWEKRLAKKNADLKEWQRKHQ